MSTLWSGAVARRSASIVVAVAVASVTLQAAPASAAPAAPRSQGRPARPVRRQLTWQPVDAATGYEVRVDNDPAFGSPEWTSATVNTVSVPTKLLAKGPQYLQVRAKDSAGAWSDWSTSGFVVGTSPAPPSPVPSTDRPWPSRPTRRC